MANASADATIKKLIGNVRKLYGPKGPLSIAPGQIKILKRLGGGSATLLEIADATGAHPAIVDKAIISLERKGLVAPLPLTPGTHRQFRLTGVARIFLDPAAARLLVEALGPRGPDDPISFEELVAALSSDLPRQ